MSKFNNESELIDQLKKDIEQSDQSKVLFLAGHFPLFYSQDSDIATENFSHWGEFSPYTLELACQLGEFAREQGKEVQFVLFVDDHAYEEMSGLNSTQRSKQRNALYELRNGPDAVLPDDYRNILTKHGFSEENILRHNHGKSGRDNNLYFSEKILRASTKQIDNACAREYTEFLEDPQYLDKKNTYLIAFVPNRCKSHICEVALLHEVTDLHASHVFMETHLPASNRADLFSMGYGVTYKKE